MIICSSLQRFRRKNYPAEGAMSAFQTVCRIQADNHKYKFLLASLSGFLGWGDMLDFIGYVL